jgi:hypothetical protein
MGIELQLGIRSAGVLSHNRVIADNNCVLYISNS